MIRSLDENDAINITIGDAIKVWQNLIYCIRPFNILCKRQYKSPNRGQLVLRGSRIFGIYWGSVVPDLEIYTDANIFALILFYTSLFVDATSHGTIPHPFICSLFLIPLPLLTYPLPLIL
jgi:hypothetical protein